MSSLWAQHTLNTGHRSESRSIWRDKVEERANSRRGNQNRNALLLITALLVLPSCEPKPMEGSLENEKRMESIQNENALLKASVLELGDRMKKLEAEVSRLQKKGTRTPSTQDARTHKRLTGSQPSPLNLQKPGEGTPTSSKSFIPLQGEPAEAKRNPMDEIGSILGAPNRGSRPQSESPKTRKGWIQ